MHYYYVTYEDNNGVFPMDSYTRMMARSMKEAIAAWHYIYGNDISFTDIYSEKSFLEKLENEERKYTRLNSVYVDGLNISIDCK